MNRRGFLGLMGVTAGAPLFGNFDIDSEPSEIVKEVIEAGDDFDTHGKYAYIHTKDGSRVGGRKRVNMQLDNYSVVNTNELEWANEGADSWLISHISIVDHNDNVLHIGAIDMEHYVHNGDRFRVSPGNLQIGLE